MKSILSNTGLILQMLPVSCRLPMLVNLDERKDYGEDRWTGIGLLEGRVVVVIYTEPDDETIRIVSLRKALSYERKQYEQYIRNRLVKS